MKLAEKYTKWQPWREKREGDAVQMRKRRRRRAEKGEGDRVGADCRGSTLRSGLEKSATKKDKERENQMFATGTKILLHFCCYK